MAARGESEAAQRAHHLTPFQDGICQDSQEFTPEGRLVGETRPQRRILDSAHAPGTSEIPQVSVAEPILAVQGSPFWPQQCPVHIYEADEAGSVTLKEPEHQDDTLLGRHVDHGRDPRGGIKASGDSAGSFSGFGFCDQYTKELPHPQAEVGVPGIHPGHSPDDNSTPRDQTAWSAEDVQENGTTGCNQPEGIGPIAGYHGCEPPCNSPSSPPLPLPGENKITSTPERSTLRDGSAGGCRNVRRPTLVARQIVQAQWEDTTGLPVGCHHRVRCLHDGLGGQLSRHTHRRPLDKGGESEQHQLPGATGGVLGPAVVRFRKEICANSAAHRQYHGDSLPQQDGRPTLSLAVGSSHRGMGVVPQEGHHYSCRASPRKGEYKGGLGVTTHIGLQRLDATPGSVPPAGGDIWSLLGRFVRIEDKCSTANILQLESRPHSLDSGCLLNLMGRDVPLPFPSLRSYPSLSGQDQQGGGVGSIDCTRLARAAMVPSTSPEVNETTNPPTSHSGYCLRPRGTSSPPSSEGSSANGRLACLRHSFHTEGLSDRVIEVIRRSWRKSTESAYSGAWKLWDSWCSQRSLDPLSAPVSEILEFLLEQYETGKQYRTINTIRSAISMTHEEVDGTRIGQHPLVSRFLKGVFNCRPPVPKYSCTWDVDIVLSYLKDLPDNESLPFQLLSHKVAMLMALSNADRCSDLAALDLKYRFSQANGEKFIIPGLTKTRRTGPPIESFYPSFEDDLRLCPVQALHCYIRKSQPLRSKSAAEEKSPLFIAVRRPHRPVKAVTIGHWLKSVMKKAGINTDAFSAHSARGAATSKAKAVGVATADILKAASWSSTSTFCRFYHRPINNGQFGLGVLRRRQPSPPNGELQTIPYSKLTDYVVVVYP